MSVSVPFHLMFVQIVLVLSSRLLSGHLLGKSCLMFICNLVISRFGFDVRIWVCLLVAFRTIRDFSSGTNLFDTHVTLNRQHS